MRSRRDEGGHARPAAWRIAKGIALSIGVALVYYAMHFFELHGWREHMRFLIWCVVYGFVIYLAIHAVYSVQRRLSGKARPGDERLGALAHLSLSMSGATIGLYIAMNLEAWFSGSTFSLPDIWKSVLTSVFIALMFQFYYAWKHSKEENLRLKAAKAEADLHVLRNQMQPHFLFNSLNSLAALIDSDPATAGEATQKLADLYRLILDGSKAPLSPLEREVRIAALYLEIERIRFGRRLSFQLPVLSPSERDVLVPSLVLQTLVENAVKHGIAGAVEGGFVHLHVRREPKGLHVEVLNSGAPLARSAAGEGTGIRNTSERLTMAFGSAHSFALTANDDGLTSAAFFVPVEA